MKIVKYQRENSDVVCGGELVEQVSYVTFSYRNRDTNTIETIDASDPKVTRFDCSSYSMMPHTLQFPVVRGESKTLALW